MAEFARARSDRQREERRCDILRTAASMLDDGTRVADLSLNELARRVGLAKSNVLRYFESREAVLLTLLDALFGAWVDDVEAALAAGDDDVDADAAPPVERVAEALAATLEKRPVLSELIANSSIVLEHNISPGVAAEYKSAAYAQTMRLIALIEARVGELSPRSRIALAASFTLVIGGAWGLCRPAPGVELAYERHPELAALRLDYRQTVRELLATTIVGLLARPAAVG